MSNYVYILRTCYADLTSYGEFKYPEKGKVICPDWNPEPVCGGGLHGLLNGTGNGNLLNWNADAKWLVLKAKAEDVVSIDDGEKVKCKQATVVFCGDRKGATDYIIAKGVDSSKVVGAFLTCGNNSTLNGGDFSILTGGDYSKLNGGHWSKLTGGFKSTLNGGNVSKLNGGNYSTLTGGYGSTLNGGDFSTLTGGEGSVLIVVYYQNGKQHVATKEIDKDSAGKTWQYDVDQGLWVEAA